MRRLGILALIIAFVPIESHADALVDLLDGKKISISIQCQYTAINRSRIISLSLNSRKNLVFQDGVGAKPVEIVNGSARIVGSGAVLAQYSSTINGNEIKIITGLYEDTKFTDTIQITGSTCSATHVVAPESFTYYDKTCRAVSCSVASAPLVVARVQKEKGESTVGSFNCNVVQPRSQSTITGLGSDPKAAVKSPADTKRKELCAEAQRTLKSARVYRRQKLWPVLVEDYYNRAAKALHDAGDLAGEQAVLAESKAPDKPDVIPEDPERVANLREAKVNVDAAQAIEKSDATCAGLTTAAERYLQAAKHYLRADEFRKTNLLMLRHDALNQLVDDARRDNRCHVVRLQRSAPEEKASLTPQQCEQALSQVAELEKGAASLATLKLRLRSGFNNAVLKMQLAARGCREPGAEPLTASECSAARNAYAMSAIHLDDIDEVFAKAGCPEP